MKWLSFRQGGLVGLVALVSCAHNKPIDNSFNPMPRIWAGIGDGIHKLEEEHAHEGAWTTAATGGEPIPIHSLVELMEETKALSMPPEERSGLRDAFSKSSKVVHYGFDCDYHALVFFDDARQAWKVIKW